LILRLQQAAADLQGDGSCDFLKGTQICYILVSVAVGNEGGLWPAFLRGERDKVPLDHQVVCYVGVSAPHPHWHIFQRLNNYSAPWCKHANKNLNLSFVAKIYEN
jgi:hypothetical protein